MNNDNGANNSSNQIESIPNATLHYCGSANEQKKALKIIKIIIGFAGRTIRIIIKTKCQDTRKIEQQCERKSLHRS